MSRAAGVLALLSGLLFSACSTAPRAPQAEATAEQTLSGRIAVHVDPHGNDPARSMNAGFDLSGSADRGELNLTTPLGTVMARARWSPGQVVLTTSQGDKRFATLDALADEVLGEALPLAALFDWLHGRPWRAAASQSIGPDSFEQLGWAVSVEGAQREWVVARRSAEPVVTVRARLSALP